ncbi:MAG TPA: alpha-L-arabinofuranosidase C-terminal domain-containing protein, partial [Gemmata sp.]|nr:alpha-L-arabinofuranosidase C-terminal domain-containing protein [Gemmata sp.]
HEGKQSLRISATELSDTALGQELRLKPNQFYRITGWVRTRGLDPHTAPVFGTFQIQMPGGKGVIAGGTNHKGDTDWVKETLYFEAPSDGRVRVAVFFVGFGKGTGTAWFDDLKLEEVDPSTVPIKIARDLLFKESIDPNQYGQFIEYLCDLVPSMWAEKLCDGSFEGLTPYKVAYIKETDFREHPWYPVEATNRADFTRDHDNQVNGLLSQKIEVRGKQPCTVGIAQDGIVIEPDQPCIFSCYLRQEGIAGPVTVRLHRDGKEYATTEFHPTEKWTKFDKRLAISAPDTNATLSITFRGPGTLWIDNASLMPERTIDGWRPDVVEAVKALKPGIIRFGGSALDDSNLGEFDWRDTIGNPDKRKPFRAWGGLQPTGAGLEEIVQFCRHVGAEPLICVRVSKKGPKDAAEQVEYFNGSVKTPMGSLRAKNGHPEPYNIRFWQIGNERAGLDYETRLPEFCEAMKAADPSIKLLSSYPTAGVLEKAGKWLDYVCPHHYSIANLAGAEADLIAVRALIAKHAPGRTIKVGVTEWNTTAGDWGPRRTMLWTLENALWCSRYHNLMHRQGDLVTIANRSNLINSFCSGIIQTDNHRLYKTPTYYAQQLYATLAGNKALRIDSTLPANVAPDVSATLSPNGEIVTVFAVNPGPKEINRPIDLSAFGGEGQEVTVRTLADTRKAGEPDATNNFSRPERTVPVESKYRATAAKFDYCFPAYSLTVLQWKARQ